MFVVQRVSENFDQTVRCVAFPEVGQWLQSNPSQVSRLFWVHCRSVGYIASSGESRKFRHCRTRD